MRISNVSLLMVVVGSCGFAVSFGLAVVGIYPAMIGFAVSALLVILGFGIKMCQLCWERDDPDFGEAPHGDR